MIGPPCEAYKFSDFIMLTIMVTNFCMWYCNEQSGNDVSDQIGLNTVLIIL